MLTENEKLEETGYRTEVKKLIRDELYTGTIRIKEDGNILCRWSYFYTLGKSAEDYVMQTIRLLNNHHVPYRIVDSGNHMAAFKGGASVAKQSHFYVEVHVTDEVRN